ncbi:MAG TPA: extracellular solute-binding protein [Anaerolineaceae bacterium]|nr:extracellular solute-binding protein [Anaerolineaceae bacterium]
MKRPQFRLIALLLVFAVLLASCTPQATTEPTQASAPASSDEATQPSEPAASEPSDASAEPIELEYWVYADYAQGEALTLQQAFISEFEASHPGVKITIAGKGDEELTTGEITGAASDTLPDIFMNSPSQGAALVKAGALTNVYDQWSAMPDDYKSQFNPELIKAMTPEDGVMYGMPYTGYTSYMFRNLTVLRAAGIDPEEEITDWNVWLEQMKKVKEAGYIAIHNFSNDWWDFANIYSGIAENNEWGIDFANDQTLINPDKLAQAAAYLKEVQQYATEMGSADQGTIDLFTTNQMAFLVDGPWDNPGFEKAHEENGLDFDYVVIPGATADNHGGIEGIEFIGIAPNDHADLAWEFVTYLTAEPQMTRWAEALGRFNSNQTALSKIDHPLINLTTKAAESAVFNQPPFFVEPYPANYYQPLLENLAAIMDGDATPEDGAKAAVEQMNEIIAAE